MNREIKFRVWDKENEEFFKPIYEAYKGNLLDLSISLNGELIRRTLKFPSEHISCFPDKYELQQFTGLTDKNGVEIYQGDVLNCQDRIVEVVWHKQAAQWDTNFIRYIFDLCSNGITNQEWKYRAIVIGNVYETPELLEK